MFQAFWVAQDDQEGRPLYQETVERGRSREGKGSCIWGWIEFGGHEKWRERHESEICPSVHLPGGAPSAKCPGRLDARY